MEEMIKLENICAKEDLRYLKREVSYLPHRWDLYEALQRLEKYLEDREKALNILLGEDN